MTLWCKSFQIKHYYTHNSLQPCRLWNKGLIYTSYWNILFWDYFCKPVPTQQSNCLLQYPVSECIQKGEVSFLQATLLLIRNKSPVCCHKDFNCVLGFCHASLCNWFLCLFILWQSLMLWHGRQDALEADASLLIPLHATPVSSTDLLW